MHQKIERLLRLLTEKTVNGDLLWDRWEPSASSALGIVASSLGKPHAIGRYETSFGRNRVFVAKDSDQYTFVVKNSSNEDVVRINEAAIQIALQGQLVRGLYDIIEDAAITQDGTVDSIIDALS